MAHYTIIVEWDDMPFGFYSWLMNLRRNKGVTIKQLPDDDGVPIGLGFDIEEDDYENNKTFIEMLTKFGNPNRKTRLKRWMILDNVKKTVYIHE